MKSPLEDKSIAFSERILKMSDYIYSKDKDVKYSIQIILKQVIRSATSIGANIAEARGSQSTADMITKYSISLKEAYETNYWLILLLKQGIIDNNEYKSLYGNLDEILSMLIASIKSLKKKTEQKDIDIENLKQQTKPE